MIVGNNEKQVMFSFCQVWEPKAMDENSAPKYSVQVVIDKEHKDIIAEVKQAIKAATEAGVKRGLFSAAAANNQAFRTPLRDGDQEAAEKTDGSRDYLKGKVFFNASAKEDNPPQVVDRFAKPIMVRDDFYSGCFGIADIGFFPFRFGKGGVAAGLNSLMKKRDGERLDGKVAASTVFAAFTDDGAADAEPFATGDLI